MIPSVLIITSDIDIGHLYLTVLVKEGYKAIHIQTLQQIDNPSEYNALIVNDVFTFTDQDWEILTNIKTSQQDRLPIILAHTPATNWFKEKCKISGVDIILPFPSDMNPVMEALKQLIKTNTIHNE